jgi:prevent-host-death family protein
MAILLAMTHQVNIAELKNRLSEYLEKVEQGDDIVICKRNVPVAKVEGIPTKENRSLPGWDRGRIRVLGDLEGPLIPEEDWNMLRDDFDPLK